MDGLELTQHQVNAERRVFVEHKATSLSCPCQHFGSETPIKEYKITAKLQLLLQWNPSIIMLNADNPEIRTPCKYGCFFVSQLWQFCTRIKDTPEIRTVICRGTNGACLQYKGVPLYTDICIPALWYWCLVYTQ